MEILKGFSFDLQRHADWTLVSADLTGPTSGNSAYYKVSGAEGSQDSTITIGAASSLDGQAGSYYLAVTNTGGTYTFGFVNGTGTEYDTDTLKITTLKFTASSDAKNAKIVPGTTITSLTMKSISGGSISNGAKTYTATSGSTATVDFSSTTPTLVDGSVALTNESVTVETGEIVKAGASTTINVSAKGEVSGLKKGSVFDIGSDPSDGEKCVKYTVSGDGLSIEANPGDAGVQTYLLTSALSNTKIQSEAGVTAVDKISNGVKVTKTAGFSVKDTAGDAQPILGVDSSSVTTYVYKKNGVILQAGYSDSSLGDFLGTLKYDGSQYYMYDASGSKIGQYMTGLVNDVTTIRGGSGNDTLAGDDGAVLGNTVAITVDGGAGNDLLHVAPVSGSSIVGGAGNDTLKTGASTGATANVILTGGDGNDEFTVIDTTKAASNWSVIGGAGNDVITIDGQTTGGVEWSVDGGAGNDAISVGKNVTNSSILGGEGADTISSNSATNSILGGAGNDVFDISTGAANVFDYAYGEDVLKTSANSETALLTAVKTMATTAAQLTKDGFLDFNAAGAGGAQTATIASSQGFYAVTLTDDGTTKAKVDLAWVKEDSTAINGGLSKTGNKMVLVGTTNEVGDSLYGGAKDDTIFAGVGDSVYGGAGNDSIAIGTNAYGVYVGLSTAGGKDVVDNFYAGWDIETADAVQVVDGSIDKLTGSYTTGNVSLKSGTATLNITNMQNTSATDAKILINGKKVDAIAENQEVKVGDDDTIADYYVGTKSSGIDMSAYTGDVQVDLGSAMFRNIKTFKAGTGKMSVLGGTANETLYGGTGSTSLYGGAGKDSLVSGTGKTEFFITNGAGKDSVAGFVVGTDEEKSDVLNIFNAGISGITRSDDGVFTVKVSDNDSIQVSQSTSGYDQKIQWASGEAKGVAKIGMSSTANTFTFDKDVTNYLGGSKNDTVTYSGTDDVNVWVDNDGSYASIETFDASSVTGNVTLAGGAASETIKGGSGDSSLWGGAGNQKDILVGNSSGTNTFFYGLGNGSDSISGSSKDTVNLFDIKLSDITEAKVDTSNRTVYFTTSQGDKVTVSGGVQDFTVGGTTYTTNYESENDWKVKQ